MGFIDKYVLCSYIFIEQEIRYFVHHTRCQGTSIDVMSDGTKHFDVQAAMLCAIAY